MKKQTAFIVFVSVGNYEDHFNKNLFVTFDKNVATKYVTKFNKTIKKLKQHYKQFEDEDGWIKKEYIEERFCNWDLVSKTNKSFWREIEIR